MNRYALDLAAAAITSAAGGAEQPTPIQAALQPYLDRHELAGAVTLVANRERVLSIDAVGWADLAAKRPMQADTLFWIASQTKPLTAAAVMMLVDEGKLQLDDPVERYLPEFGGLLVIAEHDDQHTLLRPPIHPITIRNLLSHTAGLRFASPLEAPTLDGLPLATAVRSHALQPLEFEPDSRYQYSNAGINTAARILEVVSGQRYEEFLQERLCDPLGMVDTTFWPSAAQVARLATVYQPNEAQTELQPTTISQLHYPLTDRAKRYAMPAGGLFSTVADCGRFCAMLLNDGALDGRRYLSAAAVAEMTRRQTGPEISESYGLGISVNGASFGHGGALSSHMGVDRQTRLIMVWLVQHAGFIGQGDQAQGAFRAAAQAAFGAP